MSIGFANDGCPTDPNPGQAYAAITTLDPRADDRQRQVTLGRDRVTIERSFRGIAMRLSVPVAAYQGVCVTLKQGQAGEFIYQIRLDHRDADLCVPLAEAPDDSRIWADWRGWARFFDLPPLIERNNAISVWGPRPGLSDATRAKRRVKQRRPAFLARRLAQPPAAPIVHREGELIAPD